MNHSKVSFSFETNSESAPFLFVLYSGYQDVVIILTFMIRPAKTLKVILGIDKTSDVVEAFNTFRTALL